MTVRPSKTCFLKMENAKFTLDALKPKIPEPIYRMLRGVKIRITRVRFLIVKRMVLKDWTNHWADQFTHQSEQRATRAALHIRPVGVNGPPTPRVLQLHPPEKQKAL